MIEAYEWAGRLPFWRFLSEEEQNSVLDSVRICAYPRDSILYSNSGECLGFITILTGAVRTILISPEGREVTLYRLGEGDSDVLSALCVLSRIAFRTQMLAESDCQVLIVPPPVLSRLKETNPGVKGWIYDRLMDRFDQVMHVMEQILFSRVGQRLARFLLDRFEATGDPAVAVTQEKLAAGINSVREVVARTLKPLERNGILEVKRGKIIIREPERLREIGMGLRQYAPIAKKKGIVT